MMSYQKSPIIDENETAVLLVTKITPLPTTTTSGHGSKWRVALVAGMLLLLVACGVVWMRPERSSYTTAAEGLLVATQGHTPCLPATSTFSGISETTSVGKRYAFETCYKLELGDEAKYCWSKSYYNDDYYLGVLNGYYQCYPNPPGGGWKSHSAKNLHPNHQCGPPCQEMYQ